VKKTFLVLLLVACLAAVAWTGYLLFTDRIEPVVGIIVLIVNIGVLIWNISVLRSYRVGVGAIVSIFLIIALIGATIGAFAGVAPFSEIKDKIADYFGGSGITARIAPENVISTDAYCSVLVELTPSDSVDLDVIYCVELVSSEGYSFGRYLVYWTDYDSRTIKTVTFTISGGDKVATEIERLDQEALAKWLSGEGLEDTMKWYEQNLNDILKVKISKIEQLVTEARIYAEPLSTGDYSVFAELTPSSFVRAREDYSVHLQWEVEGEYRWSSTSVTWSQEELDMNQTQIVSFGNFAKDFWESYTFTVKVLPAE